MSSENKEINQVNQENVEDNREEERNQKKNVNQAGSRVNVKKINSSPSPENSTSGVGGTEYILFLILILLLVGNKKTFTPYFELFNQQTRQIKQMLGAFTVTADELKSALSAPGQLLRF